MSVSAKVGVEYYVDQSKVSKVFQTYRKGVEEITSVNIRQNIADALIKDSGTMDIGTLAGEGRTQLLDNVTKAVKAKLDPIGIIIVKLSWTDDLKYPQQVTDSINAINAKIEATQKTLLRENEIAQTKAEAQKTIEAARGEAESNVLRAKAESEAITVKAKAEADAIALRAEALRKNPEVLQLEAIGKWNGELPQYMTSGASAPFIQVK